MRAGATNGVAATCVQVQMPSLKAYHYNNEHMLEVLVLSVVTRVPYLGGDENTFSSKL